MPDLLLELFSEEIPARIRQCWLSLFNSRAMLYRNRNHIPHFDAGMAVVQGLPGNVVAFGEMGIANTSAAALLMARLTGISIADATGRGTGRRLGRKRRRRRRDGAGAHASVTLSGFTPDTNRSAVMNMASGPAGLVPWMSTVGTFFMG